MANSILRYPFSITIILSLFLLAGCGGGGESTIDSTTPFIGGQNGLIASFITGAPPAEVFDAGNFPFGISVQLKNVGEAAVPAERAYVEILGLNPLDFGVPSQDYLIRNLPNELTAARKNFDGSVLAGGQTLVEFPDSTELSSVPSLKYVPDLHGNVPVHIRADICYDYKTSTSTKICVKRNLLETGRSELCAVSGEKTTFNSGGPIHITQFREEPIGADKIQVNFVIEHIGDPNDAFFNVDSSLENGCLDTITNPDRFVVKVIPKTRIGDAVPECMGLERPEAVGGVTIGYVHLFDGAPRPVICTLDVSGVDSTFEHLFEVDLEYKYLQSIQTDVLVKDVGLSS